MAELFQTGLVVDLIVAFILVEAVALALLGRRRGGGLALGELALVLLPGVFLLLALRGALVDAHWTWIAACLVLSLLFHLADIKRRWSS